MNLPQELWDTILKIKSWDAKRKRLERRLQFPQFVRQYGESMMYFSTSHWEWLVIGTVVLMSRPNKSCYQ